MIMSTMRGAYMKPAVKVIEGYVHSGRVGVLVELALETSFTAGMAQFKQLARDLALQVASASVESVEALMAQPFVKEPSVSVGQLVAEASRELHERIAITRFIRWQVEDEGVSSPEPSPAALAAFAPRRR